MTHLALFVPAAVGEVAVRDSYHRRMASELRNNGTTVDVVELAGGLPLADDTAREAACASWDRLAAATRPVIDSLAMPTFAGMEDALAARGAVGLIHHAAAWAAGVAEADRAALQRVERRLYSRLYRLIVTSDSTAERLVTEHGIDRARIAVVVPGADDAPRCHGSGGPGCAILSIGALVPRKGHDVLLRALARLFDLDWHLTVAGSPAREPQHAAMLKALTEQLGIAQRVRFAGAVTGTARQALWHGADLFALATWFEGYGMTVAEALKRGLPVAVCSGGAAASLVSAEAGVVCEPGDVVQLSKALRRLIFSAELRTEMGEAAWQIGQTLPDWGTQAENFAASLSSG